MSRSDYQLLAAVFRAQREELVDALENAEGSHMFVGVLICHDTLVQRIAHVLKSDNEQFDYDRFFAACGMKDIE